MAAMELQITGSEELIRKLQELDQDLGEALGGALYRQGEMLRGESQAITPVLTGTLKASAFVTEPGMMNRDSSGRFLAGGGSLAVTVGYGGAASAYAARVHEVIRPHKIGQAKYLETPFLQRAKVMAEEMGVYIKRSVGL